MQIKRPKKENFRIPTMNKFPTRKTSLSSSPPSNFSTTPRLETNKPPSLLIQSPKKTPRKNEDSSNSSHDNDNESISIKNMNLGLETSPSSSIKKLHELKSKNTINPFSRRSSFTSKIEILSNPLTSSPRITAILNNFNNPLFKRRGSIQDPEFRTNLNIQQLE